MGNWPQGRKCPPPPGLQAKGGLEGPWKLCLGSGSGPIRGPVDTAWAPAPPAHSHRLKRTLCPLTRSLPQPASWRFPAQLRAVLITAAAAPPAPPPALRAAAACAVGRMPGGAPSCPERGVAGAAGARRSWKAVCVCVCRGAWRGQPPAPGGLCAEGHWASSASRSPVASCARSRAGFQKPEGSLEGLRGQHCLQLRVPKAASPGSPPPR